MTSPAPVHRAPWILARSAQVAIALTAVQDVFRAVALRGEHLRPSAAALHRSGTLSLVATYLTVAAGVLFLVWLTRGRRNARTLLPGSVSVSAVSSVVVWFIPFVNFYVPRRIVREIERASARAAGREVGGALVNTWWGVWLGHGLVELVSQADGGKHLALLVASEAMMIAAAVLVILVIDRITSMQDAALSGEPVAGAPAIESA